MEKIINLSATDYEYDQLMEVIRRKIENIDDNQNLLVKEIFKSRLKAIFASLGIKKSSFNGWRKVSPYADDNDIIITIKDADDNYNLLKKNYILMQSLCKFYNQLVIQNDNVFDKIQLPIFEEIINGKWAELAQTLSTHGYNLSVEEWADKFNIIYCKWFKAGETRRNNLFGS